jgi:hypothetical protein
MSIEETISKHPCPIIRAKITENIKPSRADFTDLGDAIFCGIIWQHTKEGVSFWKQLYENDTAPYSDLKHLDNSYVPEPLQSPVMWRKIDKDNLPIHTVAVIHKNDLTQIFTGTLELNRHNEITLYVGNGQYLPGFTHYLPLLELLTLPIEA